MTEIDGFDIRIEVPTRAEVFEIQISAASSIVFMGANGTGKTRLGVFLDREISNRGSEVHRVAAHRSLGLNPNIVPPSLHIAKNQLFYGLDQGTHHQKNDHRYQGKPETVLLNDFDKVLGVLYAENNDVSIFYRQTVSAKPDVLHPVPSAIIDNLKCIWETLLPHRELVVLGGDLKTKTKNGPEYSASDMSDGERVIFYLIGQALIANPSTVLIFDEPELHINKSILGKLWDAIEAARPDCAFLYITHDVDFAISRRNATKYALRAYQSNPQPAWDIELIPVDQDIPDEIVAAIMGSRSPVLFVEGDKGSLDLSLYGHVYKEFTVIPVGSCDQVIQAVTSFANRPELHRYGCVGLIDGDGRTDEDSKNLAAKRIYLLPVSEAENLLLLPNVFLAIAEALKFTAGEASELLVDLQKTIFEQAKKDIDSTCTRYTKRNIDAAIKRISSDANDIASLKRDFSEAIAGVDVEKIFADVKVELTDALERQDYEKLLRYYDNKGLLAEAAKLLKYQKKPFEAFIGRELRFAANNTLSQALFLYLPRIEIPA